MKQLVSSKNQLLRPLAPRLAACEAEHRGESVIVRAHRWVLTRGHCGGGQVGAQDV